MNILCKRFGISKQAGYKRLKKEDEAFSQLQIVKKLVHPIRYEQPYMGTEKIYGLIKNELKTLNLKIGRCKLNSILKQNGMLVRKRKKYVTTTNSYHRFRKYPNLIKDISITQPEQVWVADITYIKTDDGSNFLHLITKALKIALKQRKYPDRKLVHHSDRGIQYCSDEYIHTLLENKIEISMTQNSDPYENAIAERVNGILKQEFSIGDGFKNHLVALAEIKKSIFIYNHKRPHRSCKMLTPAIAHLNGKYMLPSYSIKRNFENDLSFKFYT